MLRIVQLLVRMRSEGYSSRRVCVCVCVCVCVSVHTRYSGSARD